jgi:uncharacterized protein YjdB
MKANVFLSLNVWMLTLMSSHAQSPYISKVYDFMPAPGQFVNQMPAYKNGDTKADMIRKAENCIKGVEKELISLGGYGGYIVFGFDRPVRNVPGKYDFRIWGNAFTADANPNPNASKLGGSCEPGIVMVSKDVNGNGEPDDPWYELAGSEYKSPATIKNYKITYYKPDENKEKVPDPNDKNLNDITYIRWTTNGHGDGYLYRNIYNNGSYYPQWLSEDELVFEGTKLANNGVDESGKGTYWVQYFYDWGYADNYPNGNDYSCLNIEWAVDAWGNPVHLDEIRFVKVYNAVNQNCGWLGEASTEIMGAEDLHVLGVDINAPVLVKGVSLNKSSLSFQLGQNTSASLSASLTPANTSHTALTWSTSNSRVATVTGTGRQVTIHAVAEGTAVITVVSSGYFTASCAVTVSKDETPPNPGVVSVTGVTLNKSELQLNRGGMETLFATVTPTDADNPAVHWSSSNTAVAEATVNGLVFAKADGTAIITVTTADGGYQATCTVTVGRTTAVEQVRETAPQVSCANGELQIRNLERAECTIVNLSGQVLQTFKTGAADDRRPLSLPSGIYLLHTRKEDHIQTFKFVVY